MMKRKEHFTWGNAISQNMPHMKIKTIYRRVELDKWVKPVVRAGVKR